MVVVDVVEQSVRDVALGGASRPITDRLSEVYFFFHGMAPSYVLLFLSLSLLRSYLEVLTVVRELLLNE